MQIETVQNTPGGYLVNGELGVPRNPINADYQRVLDWIAKGNTPAPADPEPAFEPSDAAILLEALAIKTGVTAAERAAARAALVTRKGR